MLKVRSWSEFNDCIFCRKVWGSVENQEFHNHEDYKEGDIAIMWCMYNEVACSSVVEVRCAILYEMENYYCD